MAIPVINYAALQPQGDPLMRGIIPALQQGMQLKYAKPNMLADLRSKQLANALAQVNLNYADPMAQAKLALSQAQLPYLQSQTTGQNIGNALKNVELKYAPEMTQADLDLKRTQIPFLKTKTQLLPAATAAQLLSGAGRYNQAAWQSSPNSQLIRTLNNPQMQNLISNNPQVGASVAQTLGNIGLGNTGGGNIGNNFQLSSSMINSLMDSLNGGQSNDSGENNEQQSFQKLQQIPPQMIEQLAQGQQSGFSPSQQDINAVMGAAGDAFLKKTKTAQQLNQGTYASELDGLFQSGNQLMPSVVKYAGLLGKTKAGKDKVLAQFQQTDPDYKNYWNFTNVVAPNVANEMRRTLGGQATDYEGKLMKDLANPAYWDSNPELAMGQWNYLTNLYKTKINPSIYSSNSEINKKMKENITPQQLQQLTISSQQAQQLAQAGIAKPTNQGLSANQVQQMAQEAIAQGADPEMVQQRIKQLMGGK